MIMIDDYNNPSEEFVRSIDINTLLPQRPPFIMIGRLEHFDMVCVSTSTMVKADNIFVEDNQLSASGLIENIAQTCAARIGYINKYILKKGIQIGFIGAIRNLTILHCLKLMNAFLQKWRLKKKCSVCYWHTLKLKLICGHWLRQK